MKTAIYIEDGDVQLVLTPQNEWEENALRSFGNDLSVSLKRGSFYECQGGWHRHRQYPGEDDSSVILRVRSSTREER